jgi:hypothetical protein
MQSAAASKDVNFISRMLGYLEPGRVNTFLTSIVYQRQDKDIVICILNHPATDAEMITPTVHKLLSGANATPSTNSALKEFVTTDHGKIGYLKNNLFRNKKPEKDGQDELLKNKNKL